MNDPADVLDHATSYLNLGTKLGIDATRKLPGEGFQRPWPLLDRMNEAAAKGDGTVADVRKSRCGGCERPALMFLAR